MKLLKRINQMIDTIIQSNFFKPIIFILGAIAEFYLLKLFQDNIKVQIALILFSVIIIIIYITYYITKRITINKNPFIIHELNKEQIDEGNRIFELSLGLNIYNKTRFFLLEKAAKEYHNIYAGVTLANLYMSGLNNNLEKNPKKAFELYNHILKYDKTGLVLWSIGWMYEQGCLGKIDNEKAFLYYQRASKLGYPKAYNSIGKFYETGKFVSINTVKAATNYSKAADLGDINAMLNTAFIHEKSKNEIKNAEKRFIDAIKNGSSLGKLRLAKLYMDNHNEFEKPPQKIADLIIESINTNDLSKNNEACGYFWLSKLISKYPSINISNLCSDNLQDKKQYCFLKSYTILYNLNQSNSLKGNTSKKIWEQMSQSITINIED